MLPNKTAFSKTVTTAAVQVLQRVLELSTCSEVKRLHCIQEVMKECRVSCRKNTMRRIGARFFESQRTDFCEFPM